ncbi:MAG: Inhibitor of sigma-G Gin [Pelotomaculum sp. PtaB.Bin104]|nr:MAG: Inhibitor of sigma-G Gin [Pelotomaculum sp. PtaB.Bin104]
MVNIFLHCILCRELALETEQALRVNGHCICSGCEARIVGLRAEDPEYDYYKNGLKKVWWCAKA